PLPGWLPLPPRGDRSPSRWHRQLACRSWTRWQMTPAGRRIRPGQVECSSSLLLAKNPGTFDCRRRGCEERFRLDPDLTAVVRGPKGQMAVAVDRRAFYGEWGDVEGRAQGSEAKALHRPIRQLPADQIEQKGGQQRTVHHETGVALHF